VCCRAKGIPNDQKGVIMLFILCNFFLQHIVNFDFAKVSVSFNEGDAQEILELFIISAHDRGVVFEVDFPTSFDSVDGLDGNIFWIS
jgi:hypothetical protein